MLAAIASRNLGYLIGHWITGFLYLHIDGGSAGKTSGMCDCSLIPQAGPWASLSAMDPME